MSMPGPGVQFAFEDSDALTEATRQILEERFPAADPPPSEPPAPPALEDGDGIDVATTSVDPVTTPTDEPATPAADLDQAVAEVDPGEVYPPLPGETPRDTTDPAGSPSSQSASRMEEGSAVPTQPAPPTTQVDANIALEQYLGRPITQPELTEFLGLLGRINSLPVNEQNQIVAILNGQPIQAAPIQPSTAPVQMAANPPQQIPDDPFGLEQPVAPTADPRLDTVLARQQQIEAELEARRQEDMVRQQQWIYTEIQQASQDFVATHADLGISPEELSVLEARAQQSQLLPALMQQSNNPRQSWFDVLELQLTKSPSITARAGQAHLDEEVARRQEEAQRQVAASAVSAGGGSAPVPVTPLDLSDPATARANAVAEARSMFNDMPA